MRHQCLPAECRPSHSKEQITSHENKFRPQGTQCPWLSAKSWQGQLPTAMPTANKRILTIKTGTGPHSCTRHQSNDAEKKNHSLIVLHHARFGSSKELHLEADSDFNVLFLSNLNPSKCLCLAPHHDNSATVWPNLQSLKAQAQSRDIHGHSKQSPEEPIPQQSKIPATTDDNVPQWVMSVFQTNSRRQDNQVNEPNAKQGTDTTRLP